jgi:glycosyltransferase involved in cell wall biosynthesis
MVEDPLIHVVIPTGGRTETIGDTLLSCHQQAYEKLVVWVCDNSFDSETEEIVKSFHDSRFRLIRPDRRLCMAENWEFSISHICSGFITILGDDDCLMPDCLSTVCDLIKSYPNMPVINHLPGNYYWPSYRDSLLANKLQLRPMDFKEHIVNPRDILSRVCAFTEWYGHLPFLYHGFVDSRHISKIKALKDLPFFNFCAPDIYSDVVLALHTEQFLVVNKPLTLGGQSASSNGANYASRNSVAKQFIDELPAHLTFTYQSMSMSLAVYSAIEIAFRSYPEQSRGIYIDYGKLLENALQEVKSYGEDAMVELREKLLLLYPEALVDKAFKSMDSVEDKVNLRVERTLAWRTILASRLASLPSRIRSLVAKYLVPRRADVKVVSSVISQANHEGLHWQNGAIVLNGYLDLSEFNITTVSQAAWFLRQRLMLLIDCQEPN